MKHPLITLLTACGFACLLGTTASAQSPQLASDLPFAFHVGEQNCAAGKYTLTRMGAAPPLLRGTKGSCSLFVGYGAPLSGQSQPKLVFHRYQDQYFLSEIWQEGGIGSRLPLSQREQEVREQAPSAETASTTLYLLSRR
jgi:hypothetical protein